MLWAICTEVNRKAAANCSCSKSLLLRMRAWPKRVVWPRPPPPPALSMNSLLVTLMLFWSKIVSRCLLVSGIKFWHLCPLPFNITFQQVQSWWCMTGAVEMSASYFPSSSLVITLYFHVSYSMFMYDHVRTATGWMAIKVSLHFTDNLLFIRVQIPPQVQHELLNFSPT